MDNLLVRIKKHDPHHGNVLRQLIYQGIRFQEGKGWYQVTPEVGSYLRNVRQKSHDLQSPCAFDVYLPQEAQVIDKKEVEESNPARPADKARVTVPRNEPKNTANKTVLDKETTKRGKKD